MDFRCCVGRILMETDDDDWMADEDEPGYEDLDLTFLEACMDADLDALAALVEDNLTEEEINERDRCGRTGLSHLCSAGLTPALEILFDLPEMDVNLPDKEGNTPLILAAQAGHTNAVRTLLQHFKGIRIDQPNRLGMTALMKAAIQGRTDCSRLLLYAGADPKLRDHGRKLCAEEWAAYCGRRDCADAIAKFSNTKSFYLKAIEAQRSSMKRLERSNSLPELAKEVISGPKPQHKRASLRKKIKKKLTGAATNSSSSSSSGTGGGNSGTGCGSGDNKLSVSPGSRSPFAVIARCVSTPVLPGAINSGTGGGADDGGLGTGMGLSRPVSTDNIPRVEVTTAPREEGGDFGGGGRTIRGRRRILHGSSAPVRPPSPSSPSSPSSPTSFSTSKAVGNGCSNSSSSTNSPATAHSPVATPMNEDELIGAQENCRKETKVNSSKGLDNRDTQQLNNTAATVAATTRSDKNHQPSPATVPAATTSSTTATATTATTTAETTRSNSTSNHTSLPHSEGHVTIT